MADRRLVALVVLDGWGLTKPGPGNAITLAHTPHLSAWWKNYPHTELIAKGTAVGLPAETTGNSEVGHMNLGAGYVVPEDQVRIQESIDDKTFFANPALVAACTSAKEHQSNIHILTLLGPGQVHSCLEHLWAMLELAQQQQVGPTYVHLISDGRDSSPTWLGKNAITIQQRIEQLGGVVASLAGRYYAMDRDKRWERTGAAYKLLTERKGQHAADLASAVQSSYQRQITDEFIEPTVIANGKALSDGDSLVFLNFRTDRTRQLSHALVDHTFTGFTRSIKIADLHLVTMTEYDTNLNVAGVVFEPIVVAEPLAKVLSDAGLTQLHAAETEKYAHVTYFFNGGREEPFAGEERTMIPSPKVATYDLQPEMSARELTKAVCDKIATQAFDVIIMNYANADMVGHTGNLEATIKAVETVDACLAELHHSIVALGGVMLITADHGNAEILINAISGEIDTEHNPSNVPLIVVGDHLPGTLKAGALASVSPTILQLLHLQVPADMTAPSLWETT